MRKITINLYQFDELSDEARKNAIKNLRDKIAEEYNDLDAYSYLQTLKAIEKNFQIRLTNWEVDSYHHWFTFEFNDDIGNSYIDGEFFDDPKFLSRYVLTVEERIKK